MTEKIYYIENSPILSHTLSVLEELLPCFINREFIEMNFSQITIKARNEDLVTVEEYLAPLV